MDKTLSLEQTFYTKIHIYENKINTIANFTFISKL